MFQSKKGFTLLEVMIVIGIIGIMTAIMLVYFSNDEKTDKMLQLSAGEVVAAIREAQNNALNGKQSDSSKIPCDYQFEKNGSSGYKITYHYHSPESDGCSSIQDYAAYDLKNGISVDDFSPVKFNIPFGTGVSLSYIRLQKNSRYYYVCITSGGDVFSCKTDSCNNKSSC